MIETETIHRRRCDLCRGEIDRLQGAKADPIGFFLPLEWGGESKRAPDVCRSCLKSVFAYMVKALDGPGKVVGAPR